jgi:glycosyltransferase involved in cell wall biosynthesis
LISIVVPTYNRVVSLKRCVDSILSQYCKELELIIVNDSSTDLTMEYLETLKADHAFIKVIHNQNNQGVNYSRNRGIENASKRFILFLDSDDCLADNSLDRIFTTVKENPGFRHFLFLVSDRKEEFSHLNTRIIVKYNEWVRSNMTGDFVHLVTAATMKNFLFFEQFRRFENLNWLRVYKSTSPQLLAPFVAADRERGRADSLTTSSKLRDINVINAKFESQKLYYNLYYKDLAKYRSKSLTFQLLEAIMLGVACNKKAESRQMVRYANRLLVKVAGLLIILLPASLARKGIIRYSAIK